MISKLFGRFLSMLFRLSLNLLIFNIMYKSISVFDLDSVVRACVPDGVSATVPSQSLTPRQIMEKFTRGNLPNIQREPMPGSDTDGVPEVDQVHVLDQDPFDPFMDVLDVAARNKQSRDVIDRFRAEMAENAKKQAFSGDSQSPQPAVDPSPSAE